MPTAVTWNGAAPNPPHTMPNDNRISATIAPADKTDFLGHVTNAVYAQLSPYFARSGGTPPLPNPQTHNPLPTNTFRETTHAFCVSRGEKCSNLPKKASSLTL